jgi:hypothetical protein
MIWKRYSKHVEHVNGNYHTLSVYLLVLVKPTPRIRISCIIDILRE